MWLYAMPVQLACASDSQSAGFAASLSRISASQKPDLEKYMNEVKCRCTAEANKGHYKHEMYISDCLCSVQEIREAVEKLGLTVLLAKKINGDKSVKLALEWPVPNALGEISGGNATQSRPLKRPRVQESGSGGPGNASTIFSSCGGASTSPVSDPNFAASMSAISAACGPDMNKYMQSVKDQCRREAEKGHRKAEMYIFDCLSSVSEITEEVEMLGLMVTHASRSEGTGKAVKLKVEWPDSADGVRVGQPSGLEKGNIKKECCICLEQETMCRLHPCGHVVGKNCARKLLDDGGACPCCRTTLRFVHAIFEP